MSQTQVHLVEQVAALQTSHDIDRLLPLFAEDATFEDVALEIVANGHAEIREMFRSIYSSMARLHDDTSLCCGRWRPRRC